jgi:hypothetical protein
MSEPRVPASKASKASIERDIEHTRAELSETVQALADKADVPARVKEKVAATAESAQAAAQQVTHQVQETAQQVTHQVQGRRRTSSRPRPADAANQAMDRLPPPVRTRIGQLTATAKRRPVPTALTAAAWWLPCCSCCANCSAVPDRAEGHAPRRRWRRGAVVTGWPRISDPPNRSLARLSASC